MGRFRPTLVDLGQLRAQTGQSCCHKPFVRRSYWVRTYLRATLYPLGTPLGNPWGGISTLRATRWAPPRRSLLLHRSPCGRSPWGRQSPQVRCSPSGRRSPYVLTLACCKWQRGLESLGFGSAAVARRGGARNAPGPPVPRVFVFSAFGDEGGLGAGAKALSTRQHIAETWASSRPKRQGLGGRRWMRCGLCRLRRPLPLTSDIPPMMHNATSAGCRRRNR